MWLAILLILCVVVAAFVLISRKKAANPPQDVYVCDVCGEEECICHKEGKKP
jgi:hypothetical protein